MKQSINHEMHFPCTSCGKCCRLVGNSPQTDFLNRGDGVCRHLDENTNLCAIYEIRPLVCNIKEYYLLNLQEEFSWQEFVDMNLEVCQKL